LIDRFLFYIAFSTQLVHFLQMLKMKKLQYLQYLQLQKNSTYYLRYKLNDELAAFYDKREIKLSLKTSNLSGASAGAIGIYSSGGILLAG